MPSIDDMLDGLAELESDPGSTITWAGNSYPCNGGAELGGLLLGAGGYRTTAEVTLVVRLSVFPNGIGPNEKDEVSYKSEPDADARNLRIDNLTVFRNAFMVLECNDPNQGT